MKIDVWPFSVTEIRDAEGNKLRTIFPHISVLSKPPQLPYGTFFFLGGAFHGLSLCFLLNLRPFILLSSATHEVGNCGWGGAINKLPHD